MTGRYIGIENCVCHALNAVADEAYAALPTSVTPASETVQLALPAGYDLLSANHRHHWRAKAKIVAQIREDVTTLARAARLPKFERVRITAVLHPRDRRHQDSDNVQPTVKACVDALVAAGYLPGDDDRYVLSTTYMLGEPVKGTQLVLHFTPVGGGS